MLAPLAECVQLTEEALKEVRTVSYVLYPPLLEELGLKSAVPWYLDGFTKRSGIKTTLEIAPKFGRMSHDLEVALFRVLQESLTNVHRHSGSPEATVGWQARTELSLYKSPTRERAFNWKIRTVQGKTGWARRAWDCVA